MRSKLNKFENEGGGMAGISVLNISRMEELQVGPCIRV